MSSLWCLSRRRVLRQLCLFIYEICSYMFILVNIHGRNIGVQRTAYHILSIIAAWDVLWSQWQSISECIDIVNLSHQLARGEPPHVKVIVLQRWSHPQVMDQQTIRYCILQWMMMSLRTVNIIKLDHVV